jgi:DNA-binding NarL/FixJ family response regulator
MAVRVVLVDDHRIVLEALKRILRDEPDLEVVGMAVNGAEAIEMVCNLAPDVVVLDVAMPQINGLDVMKGLREFAPNVRVVVLSMHADPQVAIEMLTAGARAYVVKAGSVQDLVTAIRSVMAGKTYLSPEIAGTVPPKLLRPLLDRGLIPRSELSDREKQVLRLVAEGHSSREIASRLFVSAKTVVWHRQSIMGKLGLRSVAELTKYAVRMGLTPLDGHHDQSHPTDGASEQ